MKRLAPRPPSHHEPSQDLSDARLPDDVVVEQVRRLTAFAIVSGGLWGIGLLMDSLVFPRFFGQASPPAVVAVELGAVALAVAVYVWVRVSPRPASAKADAGIWLMLLNSAAVALVETVVIDPNHLMLGKLSWIAIVILLSAMIMPATPSKMLAAALASASMGPLAVWLAHLRGAVVPPPLTTLLMYVPAYSCALAAVVPSRMFTRLGRSLREARDLGSYELESKLGEGGMGEVWTARHRFLARPAAIKLVRPEAIGAGTASSSKARLAQRRFESEAQVTASLTSPHTIRLYDFGVADDGRFYYVMELLDGQDMAALVSRTGALPVPRVLYLLRQVCHSLAEAHGRGLVHRDIKPANLFVCRMGLDADVVKVLDFGLVHDVDRDAGQDLTQSLAGLEGLVGTPAFMAPEMIAGDRAVDHRADLYALGCVAYYLLTGEHVFQGSTPMQSLIAHSSTPPSPPSSRGVALPPWLDALVLACLEKDPDRRPASAADIADRMARHHDGSGWDNARAVAWWSEQAPSAAAVHAAATADVTR